MKVTFIHKARKVTLHYCDDVHEAKVRFQFRYGYWPTEPIKTEEDDPVGASNE